MCVYVCVYIYIYIHTSYMHTLPPGEPLQPADEDLGPAGARPDGALLSGTRNNKCIYIYVCMYVYVCVCIYIYIYTSNKRLVIKQHNNSSVGRESYPGVLS